MTYQETIQYLYNVAPLFQNIGQGAYKEGLSNTKALDEHFNHPHRTFRTIHMAGTNGKGSCSHTLAAILQDSGLKVGLYTSPHLLDFRERIRVNGEMIPEQRVIDFVEQEKDFFEPLYPSFFELTTALAFEYFREQNIDVAVVEVGLGGRLDCTNIINPDLCIITNISYDHMQFLGNTLPDIAREKAGIIKPNTPVVIGETNHHPDVREVFATIAHGCNAPIRFADEEDELTAVISNADGGKSYISQSFGTIRGELGGDCQRYNTATILCAVKELRKMGYSISDENVHEGFSHVSETTGLMGRWQCIARNPKVICDTGHNPGGMQYIGKQLKSMRCETLRIIIGMVSDKDISTSLTYLPKNAVYYFTQSSVRRAMDSDTFAKKAAHFGLRGTPYPTVSEAYDKAMADASPDDVIFVGGSTFIVADFMRHIGA